MDVMDNRDSKDHQTTYRHVRVLHVCIAGRFHQRYHFHGISASVVYRAQQTIRHRITHNEAADYASQLRSGKTVENQRQDYTH